MPFARPTLTGLRNQAIEDITTSGVPGLDGLLRNAVLRVLAWVMSGLAYSVYGYADWIARMGVPFTAQDEFLYAWAALVGIFPKDATGASGTAQFNGTPGQVIQQGTTLTRVDATPYETTADGTVGSNGIVEVPFTALVLGAATNCIAGTPISIATPITSINASGVTIGPTTGGADQETDDELRTRMLLRYRDPPQGGAAFDYIEWAIEVPGCTRAWVLGNGAGVGTVVVYPMFDDANAEDGGFPQGTDGVATDETRWPVIATGDQLTIANYIYTRQPVTALVYVVAPLPFPIDVALYTLDPNTQEMRDLITAALGDMFTGKAEVGGTVYPSDIYEAILATPGINHFTVSSPSAPIQAPVGSLPVMGALSVTLVN
jgi:uncharacterized phage protein gp47/JayE